MGQRELETTWSEPGIATDRAIDVTVWYPSAEGLVLNAVDDATLAEGPFRVAVWSHGHQAFATAASHLCSHLASHGWIVVSPTHTDNTLLDGDDRQMAIYAQRPRDVSAALDVVLADGTLGFCPPEWFWDGPWEVLQQKRSVAVGELDPLGSSSPTAR